MPMLWCCSWVVFRRELLEAADLYHEGKASRMLIVYEGMGPYRLLESRGARVILTTRQANDAAVALGIPADGITMLPEMQEALSMRLYKSENTLKRHLVLILFSLSPLPPICEDLPRFSTIALRTMPTPVYVGCSPSSYSSFNPEKWWRRREDIQSVLSEFVKICSFQLLEKKRLR